MDFLVTEVRVGEKKKKQRFRCIRSSFFFSFFSTTSSTSLNPVPLSSLSLSLLLSKKTQPRHQGYVEAAAAFAEESGTKPCSDLSAAAGRHAVRAALARGDVEAALSAINDADATILEKRPELSFALQQQRLIEMARRGDVEGALAHAREYLAPAAGVGGKANDEDEDDEDDEDGDEEMMKATEEGGGGGGGNKLPRSPTTQAAAKAEREQERASAAAAARLLLPELERTVALLAFDDPASSPLADLLSWQQRARVAALANAALLEASGAAGSPRLPELVKMLAWAQAKLGERGVRFPKMQDPATAALVGP